MSTTMTAQTTYPTTIFVSITPKMLGQVTEHLSSIQGINYFSPTIGRFDIAVELKAMDSRRVYETITQIRSLSGVTATRTYNPVDGSATTKTVQAADSLALVLLQVNEQAQKVLQSIQQIEQVRNAFVVQGEFDVLCTVYGRDTNEILSAVNKIADVQGVKTSETLLAYKPTWA
jgi:DNA-binding Lrp family transcriptional regulator